MFKAVDMSGNPEAFNPAECRLGLVPGTCSARKERPEAQVGSST